MKKVTEKMKEDFVNYYNKGCGTDIIARKFNVGKTTVRKYLLKSGIKFRLAPKNIISSEMHKKFIEMYKQGLSIKQIANNCNSAFFTVQRHLYKSEIKLRLRGKRKEIPQSSRELTLEKAFVLGVVGPGDGFIEIPKKYPKEGAFRICLESVDKDFIDYFALCIKKVYCLNPVTKLLKWRKGDTQPHYKVILYSKAACEDLLNYEVSFREESWRVPNVIKNAPDEIKAKYLQGFADSQGCVSLDKAILLSSKNIEGLKEIKQLFNDLKIKTWYGKIGLGITNRIFLNEFNEKVGFVIKRKQDRLINVLGSYIRK
jgi:hypothetical protein